jgi:hypothetical protein
MVPQAGKSGNGALRNADEEEDDDRKQPEKNDDPE